MSHRSSLTDAILLGSGGWIPTPQRATSSVLLRYPRQAVLLDAGTGVGHLVRDLALLGDAERLDVVVSHFHLDHIAGITYLPAIRDRLPIHIWAPGLLLTGQPAIAVLERLAGPPHLSVPLSRFVERVDEVPDGSVGIGPVTMHFRHQKRHPGGSVAMRAGDDLAYCTDTAFDPGNARFADGVSILLHEAWFTDTAPSDEHSSVGEAATVAAQAAATQLILTHVSPLDGDPDALRGAARDIFEQTTVGHDLLRLR